MKTHKRTEITIEIERVVIRRPLPLRAWCQPCGGEVVMVTVDEAARLVRVSARTLYHWVEDEKLHFTETADGGLLICLNSILPGTVVE